MTTANGTYDATKAAENTHKGIEWKRGVCSRRSLYWTITNWASVRKNTKYNPFPFRKSSQRLLIHFLFLRKRETAELFNIIVFVVAVISFFCINSVAAIVVKHALGVSSEPKSGTS